jgi:putative transposase
VARAFAPPRTSPAWVVPSRSTVNRMLSRHDLLERNPAKRPRSSWRRFSFARPRDCFQIDATETRLADGRPATIFDVLDDCTRTLVACYAAHSETAQAAVAAITRAIDAHGPPAIVLSDNGAAFTSRIIGGPDSLSQFVRVLHAHGIRPINSSPYHPQTCGKVERHHQTLNKWLAHQPQPQSIQDLQSMPATYRVYYNTQRRHSALPHRATPAQPWASAPSLGGPTSLPVQADATLHRCPVYSNGAISVAGTRTSVGIGPHRHNCHRDPQRRPRHHLHRPRPTHRPPPHPTRQELHHTHTTA